MEELREALRACAAMEAGLRLIGPAKMLASQRARKTAQAASAASQLAALGAAPEAYRKTLAQLAECYTQGADIDWLALHEGEARRRISLPAHPFLGKSCWARIASAALAVAPRVEQQEDRPAPRLAPRSPTDLQLLQIWETLLHRTQIALDDNFFALGGDSLLAVRLLQEIERHFHQALPLNILFAAPTVELLADVLQEGIEESNWTPLVPLQPKGNRIPLFLIPGWGGNVMYFQPLCRHLGDDQPAYALQARGLDGRMAPYASVADRMEDYLTAIKSVQPRGPYVLCGHSMGGYLAFELAQRLLKNGDPVALVIELDKGAPFPEDAPETITDEEDAWKILYYTISEITRQERHLTNEILAGLSREERMRTLREHVLRLYGTSPEKPSRYALGFLSVFLADVKTSYQPANPQPVSIALMRAETQLCLRARESAGMRRLKEDPAGGWQRYASGPVEVFTTPGNHNTILTEPNVARLAEPLKERLKRISEGGEHG